MNLERQPEETSTRLAGMSVLLAAAIFAGDLTLPLGVAGGVPYVALVLMSLWSPRRKYTLGIAGASTLLTGLGFFLSPSGSQLWIVIVNRFLAVFAIWVVAVLGLQRKRIEQEVRDANDSLQTRVKERTAELQTVYEDLQREIVGRSRMEEALRQSKERYELAARGAKDGFWDWNLTTNELYLSACLASMLGCHQDKIGNSPEEWFSRLHQKDVERFKAALSTHLEGKSDEVEAECRVLKKKGAVAWVLIRGVAVRDETGKAYHIAGSQTDISTRKANELKLRHEASHDPLTRLPNRALFMEGLARAIARAKRRKEFRFAVVFLDLDGFKFVNDNFGHLIGDELLIGLAQRLKACVRGQDTVARLGGDEFAILLEDIEETSDATRTAKRIQNKLNSPFHLNGQELFATVSIGIALSAADYERPEEVLHDADTAMYRAKAGGKGRHETFDRGMRKSATKRLELETDLRHAFERGELQIYYQPIVSVQSAEISACEALLRWRHPKRGAISPAEFIPLAEQTGLIQSITQWVLREACAQNKAWQAAGFPPAGISVNVSSRDFKRKGFIESVQQILDETGLDSRWLELEFTESTLMEHAEATIRLLVELHDLGIQVSIDDFGVGSSSLAYLKHFAIDSFKIDRSFLRDVILNPDDAAIVTAVITLAHNLGQKVVAEGVETQEQLAFLRSEKCDYVQGYLISPPLPAEETSKLWTRGAGRPPLLPAAQQQTRFREETEVIVDPIPL